MNDDNNERTVYAALLERSNARSERLGKRAPADWALDTIAAGVRRYLENAGALSLEQAFGIASVKPGSGRRMKIVERAERESRDYL